MVVVVVTVEVVVTIVSLSVVVEEVEDVVVVLVDVEVVLVVVDEVVVLVVVVLVELVVVVVVVDVLVLEVEVVVVELGSTTTCGWTSVQWVRSTPARLPEYCLHIVIFVSFSPGTSYHSPSRSRQSNLVVVGEILTATERFGFGVGVGSEYGGNIASLNASTRSPMGDEILE